MDIIIETSNLFSVLVENASGILESEILEVDVRSWIALPARLNESIDENIILLATDSWLLQTRTNVKNDRDSTIGMNASTQSVEDELGDTY